MSLIIFQFPRKKSSGNDFLKGYLANLKNRNKIAWKSHSQLEILSWSWQDREIAAFYVRMNNLRPESFHFHLDKGIYARDVITTNRNGRTYIKIVDIRDIDEKVVIPQVELEEFERIASSYSEHESRNYKGIPTCAINAIAIDQKQSKPCYMNYCIWIILIRKK